MDAPKIEAMDLADDPEERQVIYNAVNSFYRYKDQAHYHITHKRRQSFYAMPQKHWQLLAGPPFNVLSNLDAVDVAIDKNADIAEHFVTSGIHLYDLEMPAQHGEQSGSSPAWQGSVNPTDQEKAHSTIKQLFRDWSAEGASERASCYNPVLQALEGEYGTSARSNIKVLVPGAGLGRFVFEVARAGYTVEGNEISYHQIIASNFMLNFVEYANQFELYPWIGTFSNHVNRAQQLQKVMIPDVHAFVELAKLDSETHPFERMSFSSADFCLSYKEPENECIFNAVTTVFFIDTAPNVVKYVEAVHHCLMTGGLWINLGPLKWHFENSPQREKKGGEVAARQLNDSRSVSGDDGIGDPGSVELTEEEVIALVEQMGFVIERHEVMKIETGYINNPHSMWQGIYRPSFWVARKS